MKQEDLEKWIKKNELVIKLNTDTIEKCREEIEFAKIIIKEIKKISPNINH